MIEAQNATSQEQGRRGRLSTLRERNLPKWGSCGGRSAGLHGSKLWDCRQFLMESYRMLRQASPAYIIVQQRLLFNRFFYFFSQTANFFHRKAENYEQP